MLHNMRKVTLIWKRLYSTISKRSSNFICHNNNLILNQKRPGFVRTLWGYFNSPGNAMFVTTNIMTFAALVTYNTIANIRHEQIMEQQLLATQLLGPQPSYDPRFEDEIMFPNHSDTRDPNITDQQSFLTPVENIKIENLDTERANEVEKVKEEIEEDIMDSPLPIYTEKDIVLQKTRTVSRVNSLIAKHSLFSLFHAYCLYEDIIKDDWINAKKEVLKSENRNDNNNNEWGNEVNRLRNLSLPLLKQIYEQQKPLGTFYRIWNTKDKVDSSQLTEIYKFKIPQWNIYPGLMRYVCNNLYHNKLETLKDLDTFYKTMKTPNMKRLFRMWLYDHIHLLKRVNDDIWNEYMFTVLIRDSFQNNDIISFKKYSSILLNPENTRGKLFFSNSKQLQSPQVHIDTLLNVFEDYLVLQHQQQQKTGIDEDNSLYEDTFLRMVQLIKYNGYVTKNKTVKVLLRDDHIPLESSQQRKYFEVLSNNERLRSVLNEAALLSKREQSPTRN